MQRKRKASYTTGELNKVIDTICHPLFRDNPELIFIDGLLHAIVEQDPPLSLRKFIINNLPKLLDRLLKDLEHTAHLPAEERELKSSRETSSIILPKMNRP